MLRKRASEIVELVEKTECELRKDEEIPAGDIYIGCCESEGMRIIAQAARALQRTCPQIRYQLFSGNAQDLSDRLEKGLLDFTVMTEPGDLDQKYDVIRVVNMGIVPLIGLILNMSGVDRDTTSLLFGSLVDGVISLELGLALKGQPLGDRSGQRGLAVVNMANGADVNMGFRSFEFCLCHGEFPPCILQIIGFSIFTAFRTYFIRNCEKMQ